MSLSDPRIVYGVHSFAPYSRTTGLPYGIAKVLGGSNLALTGELVELMGGSSKFPWAIEESIVKAELQLKLRQIEDWMFQLFLGHSPTSDVSGSATGAVDALANVNGTSTVAATGIATVLAKSGSEADMKFGKYIVKVVSSSTVDVYLKSDVDIGRGNAGTYQNDLLKITATALTIVASTAVDVPNFGIKLTGGAGTIGMTIGDTAEFAVYPEYNKTMNVVIGSSTDTFPEFGAVMIAKKRGNGEMFEVDCFRVKAAGLPLGFTENAFSEPEIKAQVFYDSTKDGIAKIRWVQPKTVN